MRSPVPWPKPLTCAHGPAGPGFRLALPMDLLHGRMTIIFDRAILFCAVSASSGKLVRAEPIVALFEHGRVIAGHFSKLENEPCTYCGTGKS